MADGKGPHLLKLGLTGSGYWFTIAQTAGEAEAAQCFPNYN